MLNVHRFHHIVENNQLLGWRYTGSSHLPLESQVFLPEEVWFEKLPNPFDFWRGMPPLYVAALAARTDFAAANFMHGLIDNNADLGLIIKTATQLDPQQREQLMAELRNRKRRAGTPINPPSSGAVPKSSGHRSPAPTFSSSKIANSIAPKSVLRSASRRKSSPPPTSTSTMS